MKADFHVHTNRSVDGVHSPRVMVKCAKKAGLDTIAITDHGRLFPWIEARRLTREFGLLVIPGIEGGDIAVQKHWIALGISAVPQELSIRQILSHIRNDAGLSIAPHPHTRLGFSDYATLGFDAVEALNATEPGPAGRSGTARTYRKSPAVTPMPARCSGRPGPRLWHRDRRRHP